MFDDIYVCKIIAKKKLERTTDLFKKNEDGKVSTCVISVTSIRKFKIIAMSMTRFPMINRRKR